MTTVQHPAPGTKAEVRLRPPADYFEAPFHYANFVQASITPHEMTIHFGDYMAPISEPPHPGEVIDLQVHPVASVALPITLVETVMALMKEQLDSWNQSFRPSR